MKNLHQQVYLLLFLFGFLFSCQKATDIQNNKYAASIVVLEQIIKSELEDKGIPAISISLVDNEKTVWSAGFGHEDLAKTRLASAETIYRVGSVSKLFTDIGIMQMVEKGSINLDDPVTDYLQDFNPENPFGTDITLRQLMSHRAGLIREPPVGHYFDDTEPTLAQTVESMNETTLVYAPTSRTKYSNAGIAVVGYVLEKMSNQPFASYLKTAVLDPMGLENSSFVLNSKIEARLAEANMWAYDGRAFQAPIFELGMAPAGSMYASVTDLAQFMKVLFSNGRGPNAQVLKEETINAMWQPQFAEVGANTGYGIGFRISEWDGDIVVGHGGAIYGFSTQLLMIPGRNLGVAITASLDGTNAVLEEIARTALEAMIAVQAGEVPAPPVVYEALDPQEAKRLDGLYVAESGGTIELNERDGALYLWTRNQKLHLKKNGAKLVTDDRINKGQELEILKDGNLKGGDRVYNKIERGKPSAVNGQLASFIGEYGWDYNVLFIYEKAGQLNALIEWFYNYPLEQISDNEFAFPENGGLYHGEKIVFESDSNNEITSAVAAGIPFMKRSSGAVDGETFKIQPVKSMEELRNDALAVTPPIQPDSLLPSDLVEVVKLEPNIKLDIRYASTNNFMDAVFYQQARAFLQRPAAEALVRVHQNLKEKGYGVLIHDAYRPWYVTKMFFDATPEDMKIFVANPDPGSIHNRGAAVDLTLYDLKNGEPLQFVSGYDEFSERAFPEYPGGTSLQRYYRELLRDEMEAEGFEIYQWEWWHFNYKDAGKYPVMNKRFEEM